MTGLAVALLRAWDRADSVVFSLPLLLSRWSLARARVVAPLVALAAAGLLLAR